MKKFSISANFYETTINFYLGKKWDCECDAQTVEKEQTEP